MTALDRWKRRVRHLKAEVYAVYLACKDPRVPWYARAIAACVVGYAFSPIDLIPDFVPILGYVDDLILVPLGIALVLRMIPPTVMAECRDKAHAAVQHGNRPTNWIAAGVIIAVGLLLAALSVVLILRIMRR